MKKNNFCSYMYYIHYFFILQYVIFIFTIITHKYQYQFFSVTECNQSNPTTKSIQKDFYFLSISFNEFTTTLVIANNAMALGITIR